MAEAGKVKRCLCLNVRDDRVRCAEIHIEARRLVVRKIFVTERAGAGHHSIGTTGEHDDRTSGNTHVQRHPDK